MAYDCEPGGDPRGDWCPKCQLPMKAGEPTTLMHFATDPNGRRGTSERWHAECARPYWDTITPLLERLKSWRFGN